MERERERSRLTGVELTERMVKFFGYIFLRSVQFFFWLDTHKNKTVNLNPFGPRVLLTSATNGEIRRVLIWCPFFLRSSLQ